MACLSDSFKRGFGRAFFRHVAKILLKAVSFVRLWAWLKVSLKDGFARASGLGLRILKNMVCPAHSFAWLKESFKRGFARAFFWRVLEILLSAVSAVLLWAWFNVSLKDGFARA